MGLLRVLSQAPSRPKRDRIPHIRFCKAEKSRATAVASDYLLLCSARVITTWTPNPPPPPPPRTQQEICIFHNMANYDFDASKELLKFALRCGTLRCRSAKGFLRLNVFESESCWMLDL